MTEFKVEHKKQQSSEHGTVSQRKGATVLPDHRSQVSQVRALTDNRTVQLEQASSPIPNNDELPHQSNVGIESQSGNEPLGFNDHEQSQAVNREAVDGKRLTRNGTKWVKTGKVVQLVAVKNLVGTSKLKPKKHRSWKAHHISNARKYSKANKKYNWHKCAVKSCRRFAAVGAHVEIAGKKSHTTNRFIAPFCQHHNKRPNGTVMTLKPNEFLVGVGPGGRTVKSD
jgi:hypothetical protein